MDNNLTCDLNYKAEYERVLEEMAKAKCERNELRDRLKSLENEIRWLSGIKYAVDKIFGG